MVIYAETFIFTYVLRNYTLPVPSSTTPDIRIV